MGCGTITRLAEASGIKEGKSLDIGKDFVGAGVSLKYIPLKRGDTVHQHKHKYPHLSFLVSGAVVLANDGDTVVIQGPNAVVVDAGKYHSLHALEDSVWLCIHTAEDEVS